MRLFTRNGYDWRGRFPLHRGRPTGNGRKPIRDRAVAKLLNTGRSVVLTSAAKSHMQSERLAHQDCSCRLNGSKSGSSGMMQRTELDRGSGVAPWLSCGNGALRETRSCRRMAHAPPAVDGDPSGNAAAGAVLFQMPASQRKPGQQGRANRSTVR